TRSQFRRSITPAATYSCRSCWPAWLERVINLTRSEPNAASAPTQSVRPGQIAGGTSAPRIWRASCSVTGGSGVMDITQLLTFAHREGASDVHLSSGEPPMVRMHGDMKRIEHPALSAEEVHNMVFDIMSDAIRKVFQETNDADFSFELGDIAR